MHGCKMKRAILIRVSTNDVGTFGHLICEDFHCRTGELPWRNNEPFFSCIPVGVYVCHFGPSNQFGEAYEAKDVPYRTKILIHLGNWCGDKKKGYKRDAKGCILLGRLVGRLEGQKAVVTSKKTMARFHAYMENEDFELTLLEHYQTQKEE